MLTLTLSRYLVRALSMVKGLLVARLLGPELYGLFGLLIVFFGYSAYADLGLFRGAHEASPCTSPAAKKIKCAGRNG